jgi:hypothetical protein
MVRGLWRGVGFGVGVGTSKVAPVNVRLFVRSVSTESRHDRDCYGYDEVRGGTYVEFASEDGEASFSLKWGPEPPALGSQWELSELPAESA